MHRICVDNGLEFNKNALKRSWRVLEFCAWDLLLTLPWPWHWPWNFQFHIWNLLYLSQKWFNCHKTKNKHIDWTLGLKCDHQIWPWPWPWPWIFKVKYGICYISQPKVARLPRNEKQTYRLNSRPQMWPMGLTLTFEFSRSNVILTIW